MLLRHIRYFLAVAEHKNFTRAADALHVSQPALSQQIRQLDAPLRAPLLDRSGCPRGLHDRSHGEECVEDAFEIFRVRARTASTLPDLVLTVRITGSRALRQV